MKSFSFLVLTYNHEKYIIDHLESIKFQILTYREDFDIDLIINDDCSNDNTVGLIDSWVAENKQLFREVRKFFNTKNIGTAKSCCKMIGSLKSELFKLTAGDDIYSFENIFEGAYLFDDNTAFVSGFPLYLKNNDLYVNKISGYLHHSTKRIYSKKTLISRFQRLSYHNAPNLFYNLQCAKNRDVLDYLEKYDVIEDWPLQIAISRSYPSFKVKYTPKTFVYYRRTPGSIFLVENRRFISDRIQVYNDLFINCDNKIDKFFVWIRMVSFINRKSQLARICNLEIWSFFINSIIYLFSTLSDLFRSSIILPRHRAHYKLINENSRIFINEFRSNDQI
jgi:hypothetical protein